MEVSGQLHALATYLRGKNPWYRLNRRLGEPRRRFGRCGVEKNPLPLLGIHFIDVTSGWLVGWVFGWFIPVPPTWGIGLL
jgi:hypothetical protein